MRCLPVISLLKVIAVCVVASVATAVRGLPLEFWLASSGLRFFLALTLIYSVLVSIVGHYTRYAFRLYPIFLRVGLAIVGGATLGIVWTILATWLLWPYVREIGFPLIDSWQMGGVAAFLLGLLDLRGRSDENLQKTQAPVTRSLLARLVSLVVIGLGFVSAYLILYSLGLYTYWNLLVENEIYLVPYNYQGPVLVVFNQLNGAPARYEGRNRIYVIPSAGVLLTQFPPVKRAYTTEFWHIDTIGTRRNIQFQTSCRESDLISVRTVVACPVGFQSEPITNGFVVAKPDKQEEYRDILIDLLHTTLADLPP